jgi:hypothetical protein
MSWFYRECSCGETVWDVQYNRTDTILTCIKCGKEVNL